MNRLSMFVLGLVFGAFFSGAAAYFYGSKLLLRGVYTDATGDAHLKLAVLRKLDAGDQKRAKFYLRQSLKADVIILQGCKRDLCANAQMPVVSRALTSAEKYLGTSDYTHEP